MVRMKGRDHRIDGGERCKLRVGKFFLGMAGLPLATVLADVLADPRLSRAAAQTLENVSLTTDGGLSVAAALAVPAETPAPAVLLVHEWWGLNDQIKSVAADLAQQGYLALAIDLLSGPRDGQGG